MPTERETKRDKFRRLAGSRTRNTLKCIRLMGQLSNKNAYDYEMNDVEKMLGACEAELKQARRRFAFNGRSQVEFSLAD